MGDTSRGLEWQQQGWLAVVGGMPPGPVLALSGIVVFFLYLTWQMEDYEEQLRRRTEAGFFLLLVLGLLVLARHVLIDGEGRLAVPVSWRRHGGASGGGGGASPWVALLLVLAWHKPSFHLFRPPFFHK
jgi:hypothetical protein